MRKIIAVTCTTAATLLASAALTAADPLPQPVRQRQRWPLRRLPLPGILGKSAHILNDSADISRQVGGIVQ